VPNYEYECKNCNKVFEVFQKITDKPLEKCPKCDKDVKRLIGSGAGIIFKGAGFYATDYRRKPKADTPKTTADVCPKAKEGCNACQQAQ
jgi:putative FmdB family regulatory protein